MYLIMGCIALAIMGDFMPPGALLAQQGMAIMQSIMQFMGHAQHGAQLKHGFMHGSMHFIGQSTIVLGVLSYRLDCAKGSAMSARVTNTGSVKWSVKKRRHR